MKPLSKALVALVLVWLLVRHVDLRAVNDAFSKFRFQSIGVAVALFFISCAIAASKWRLLWGNATWWELLMANFASQLYSLLLPGQLAGEVVKSIRVGRRFSDTAGVAASVLVDRVTGLVGLLVLACIGLQFSSNALARRVGVPLLVLTAALVCTLYVVALPAVFRAVVSVLGKVDARFLWFRRASKKLVEFVAAWALLVSNPRTMLAAIALGIGYQVVAVCINVIIAFDLGVDVHFADWCWVLGLVSVAVLLPITIAGIGVREGAYAGSLSLLGVPIEKAVAVSIIGFGITLLGAVVGAIVELSSPSITRRRH